MKEVINMYEELRKILADQLHIDIEKITKDAKIIDDLGADSLDIFQLLMTIEEKFKIVIPDEELAKIVTFGNITDYLEAFAF